MVRLPIAVFILAFRKSLLMPWSDCVLPMTPCKASYISVCIWVFMGYISLNTISILPVSPCRQRRRFSPQMRVNRFVFLNLPILKPRGSSWRNGLAPQSPLPAGYVTLLVDSRSPPLGLMPFHSEEQGISYKPPFFLCIPIIRASAVAKSRRTIRNIGTPHLIWSVDD